MSNETTKTRRPLRFLHLSEAVADVRRLNSGGYDRVGNWSLAEILDHLNRTMRMAFDGPPYRVPWPLTTFCKWLLFEKMRRGVPIYKRGPAPKTLRPDASIPAEQAIAEFEQWTARIEADDACLTQRHPIFGRLDTDEWRIMQLWHVAHHLSFLIPRITGPV